MFTSRCFLTIECKEIIRHALLKVDYVVCLIAIKFAMNGGCTVKTIKHTVNPDFGATLAIKIKDNVTISWRFAITIVLFLL